MKTIALILTVLLAGCNLAIAQSPYATRLPAELQTAQMDSLADVTWLQGTTPAIRVEPLLRGRPVAVDADTTVRMVIGPSATGKLYAARTNLAAVTNAYEIQWPTIGTNSAGEAWFYTVLFDREGKTYWSGSGSLYIEETTSTASNGLAWIEYTTPNVGWQNIVGDPGENPALVAYLAEHGGGSTEGYVPTYRTITINGVAFDLSANREWTVEGGGGTPTTNAFAGLPSILVSADWTWTNSIYAVGADTSSTNIAVTLPDAGTNFVSVIIRKFSNLNNLTIMRGTNTVYTLYDDGSTSSYDWWPQRTNWYWRN